MEGHRTLAKFGWDICHLSSSSLPPYLLRHLPVHFYESQNYEQLYLILRNNDYVSASEKIGRALPSRVIIWSPKRWEGDTFYIGKVGDCRIVERTGTPPDSISLTCLNCGFSVFAYDGEWKEPNKCPACDWAGNEPERLAFEELEAKYGKDKADGLV
jgi:hypothetical protein